MKIIYVNQNGIKLIQCNKIISLPDLRKELEIYEENSWSKMVYRQFSHSGTVIVCGARSESKDLPIMGITRSGIGIKGPFVIAALVPVKGLWEIGGMSETRIEITLREFQLVKH